MSFINDLLDFTVSISYQPGPSCTVTHKFCSDQICLHWIGMAKSMHWCACVPLALWRQTESGSWLWDFGRPQPRVGGLSVAKTERIRRMSKSEAARRAWKTKNARKKRAEEEKSSSDSSSD